MDANRVALLLGASLGLWCCRYRYEELSSSALSSGESGASSASDNAAGEASSSGGNASGGSTTEPSSGGASDAAAGDGSVGGAAEPSGGNSGTGGSTTTGGASGGSAGGSAGGSSGGTAGGGVGGGSAGAAGAGGSGSAGCSNATYGGHNYLVCTSPKSFINAAVDCATHGYRPVRIDSAGEQTFVHGTIPIADQNNNNVALWRWLGGDDQGVSGNWQWSDGAQFWTGGKGGSAVNGAYTNWNTNQPLANQFCLAMEARAGTWYAMDCSAAKPYVCEQY